MKKGALYTIGSIVILLICLVAFVLPSTLMNGKNPDKLPSFGKYNGKEIRYEQGTPFANYVSQYGQMFQSRGTQIDSSTYYYIFSYAFNATVQEMAYTDAVKRSGYVVPTTAVNRKMIPYFSDENGNYSSKLYKQAPAAEVANLKGIIEGNLYSSRFYDDNFGSANEMLGSTALFGIKESDSELDFLSAYNDTKRGFDMAVFPLSDYPEEETVKFGESHKDKFIKYDMSVITCENKADADKVIKRLNNSEITFTDAVSEYSGKTYSNTEGKLTVPYQYQISNILENKDDISKLMDLKKGQMSEVVKTLSGYSIFLANEDSVLPNFADENDRNIVQGYLTSYEVSVIEDYFTAKATDFTSAVIAGDFDSACSKFGVEKVTVAPFPLNYGSVSISQSVDTSTNGLSGADKNDNFLKTAFSLKLNEVSKPIVINKNVVVLQYTKAEKATEDDDLGVVDQLTGFDENSSTAAIMDSDKFENNFAQVYFNYLMK